MQSHYRYKKNRTVKSAEFTLPDIDALPRLAVAVEDEHGTENVYCAAEINGRFLGFPERVPEYKANRREHRVLDSDKNNTFYMILPESAKGKKIKIY